MLGMGKSAMEVDNNKLQPADSHGLKVVSFGFFADQNHQAAIYRGPIISGILKQFLVDTNWTDLDYLIVDLPPGTGDIPLTLAQTIPITGIVVVTTPQEVASNVAVKAFGMFQKLNVPIIGVIENMSYFQCPNCNNTHFIFGKEGARRMSEKYGLQFLGEIPLNPGIMEGSDSGRPVLVTDPNSSMSNAFMIVAKNVAARCSVIASQLAEELTAEVAT
jgi:ATP-binding protein involved in chromosome partitioning